MSDKMKAFQHVQFSAAVESANEACMPPIMDVSIQIEKIYRYRTYQIEIIKIYNNSKNTIRLRKKDLVCLGEGRTIAIENTLLRQGGFTKATRLVLNQRMKASVFGHIQIEMCIFEGRI